MPTTPTTRPDSDGGDDHDEPPSIPAIDWDAAPSFVRIGSVEASQLVEAREWMTDRGDRLAGVAGDWLLTDGDRQWTVADDVFHVTYRRRSDGRFEKHATIKAVQAKSELTILTLEGPATAHQGDWIARNPSGDCWPITDQVFQRSYSRVESRP